MTSVPNSDNSEHDVVLRGLEDMMERIRMEQAEDDAELARDSLGGVAWFDAPVPARLHECWVQTRGWVGFDQVHRCACGAIRNPRFGGGWIDKNSRLGEQKPASERRANRVHMFMAFLGLSIALAGVAIVAFAVSGAQIVGAVTGLLWLAFGGGGAAFAWKTRYTS
jgi:hypothetical protein